ncbi:MAG: hypothetical protein AB4050_11365 [Synechococcus sp.]
MPYPGDEQEASNSLHCLTICSVIPSGLFTAIYITANCSRLAIELSQAELGRWLYWDGLG